MDIQCISCTFILRRSCIIATINYCISAKDRLFSTSGCYCDNIIYRSSIAASTTSNNLTVYLTATDSYFIAICRLTCTISTIDLTVYFAAADNNLITIRTTICRLSTFNALIYR